MFAPLLLVLTPLVQQAGHAEPVNVAVLRSGARVECTPGVGPGDRMVPTPFGKYDASMDPVREVVNAASEVELLALVRRNDPIAWIDRASQRGLLTELHGAAVKAVKEGSPEAVPLLDVLEAWGTGIDPIPAKVPYEKRVEYLWQQVAKAEPARGALLTGRLSKEIPGPTARFNQRITLVDLRRALKSSNPTLRRAAAVVSGRQAEMDMEIGLFVSSLDDPDLPVRSTSAATLAALDEDRALARWTLALWREKKDAKRVLAVEHLGNFGNALTVDLLMNTLAAAQSSSSGHTGVAAYVSFTRQISIVQDFDVQIAQAAAIADPVIGVIQEGTVLQVRVISVTVTRKIMGSLGRLTGANPGPKPEHWLRWYASQQQKKAGP